jgi:hypothetical protein
VNQTQKIAALAVMCLAARKCDACPTEWLDGYDLDELEREGFMRRPKNSLIPNGYVYLTEHGHSTLKALVNGLPFPDAHLEAP